MGRGGYEIREVMWEEKKDSKFPSLWTSLAVQWLRLCASNAGGTGSIPDWGTKIPRASKRGQKKKKKFPSLEDRKTMAH